MIFMKYIITQMIIRLNENPSLEQLILPKMLHDPRALYYPCVKMKHPLFYPSLFDAGYFSLTPLDYLVFHGNHQYSMWTYV